ncbi:Glypican-5 isoform X1 [Aix galericulata]|nr:Glypican-5 isoform X1 [Aix galericulata]
MAKEAAEPVKKLFRDISLYILGAETTVEGAVLRFFDSLFPLVYSRLINPGITDLSEDYTECLRLTRQDINPFGRYSKNMVTELSKSLWASRMLSQALSLGIEVINTTEHAVLSKECSRALVKMQYCPHCQGLTLIRPCVGYCLNVMRGCLASVSELDAQWREYISTLEYLTNEMAASHDLEIALTGIRNSINEAILHAQLNGPQLSATDALALCEEEPPVAHELLLVLPRASPVGWHAWRLQGTEVGLQRFSSKPGGIHGDRYAQCCLGSWRGLCQLQSGRGLEPGGL